jgi:small subunit ribosomal protein S6
MKRSYELMLVLRPEAEVTEKTAQEVVEKLVAGEAKATSVSVLGKKMLAYPIKKQTEGIYVLAKLDGNVRVSEIEKRMNMGTQVIRYLLTVVN